MERFFRSLKSEWIPQTGYHSFTEAKHDIIDYIIGYYSQVSLIGTTADYRQMRRSKNIGLNTIPWPNRN